MKEFDDNVGCAEGTAPIPAVVYRLGYSTVRSSRFAQCLWKGLSVRRGTGRVVAFLSTGGSHEVKKSAWANPF